MIDGIRLLIGGSFGLTAPGVVHPEINQLEANYLAYWQLYSGWIEALHGPHPPVEKVVFHQGDLYVTSGDLNETNGLSVLRAGLWLTTDLEQGNAFFGNGIITDLTPLPDGMLVLGDFYYSSIPYSGSDAAILSEGIGGQGYASFDTIVYAGAVFQDQLFFAGEFTKINGQPFENLVQLDLMTPAPEPRPETALRVWTADGALFWESEKWREDVSLVLYDMQGRRLRTISLNSLQGTEVISDLPRGAYVWQAVVEGRRVAGKIVH